MEESVQGQSNTMGIVSLVTGILGILLSFCCPFVGIILGLVALICGFIAKGKQQKFAMVGIILGLVAIVLSIIMMVIVGAQISDIKGQIEDIIEFEFE